MKLEEDIGISFRNIRSLRESSEKESSPTLMTSSVKNVNISAAARANRGQFLSDNGPNKMYRLSDGQRMTKGKRKLSLCEFNTNFSPKKIPKITKYFNQFSKARLGIDPERGQADKQPTSSSPDGQLCSKGDFN